MTISRLGSVINADLLPQVYDQYGLGFALFVGFLVCLFSMANAFGLVWLDRENEKRNPRAERAVVSEDEKFKWSDIYEFNISFWLLTGSCVVTYMSVFPYIQNASDLL